MKAKKNIDVEIPFGKESPSTAETEDIMARKISSRTQQIVRNEEEPLADNTINTVIPINTLNTPTKDFNGSEFWRTGRLS